MLLKFHFLFVDNLQFLLSPQGVNISTDEYTFNSELDDKSNKNHLAWDVEIEEKIIKFYSDAANQSKMLMADIPRAFTRVVKKRSPRLPQLQSLFAN